MYARVGQEEERREAKEGVRARAIPVRGESQAA